MPPIAGFLTKKPGICLTVSAPGFLNGLTALAHATTNCFPMILISGSSEREIVDLQQGDYEEMDQLAIAKTMCKAAFRVLHAADIGIGLARAIRAAVSGRPGGVYLDLPAKLFGQVMDAAAGKKSLVKVIDAAPAQIPAPAAIKRALDVLKNAKRPLIILGKGAAYAQADDAIRSFFEKSGVRSCDEHGQGPVAGHASAVRRRGALHRAEGRRRRDADRRAAELAAVARQGQDLGRSAEEIHPDRHRAEGNGFQRRDRRRPWSAISAPASRRCWQGMGGKWPAAPADWTNAVSQQARRQRRQNGAAADEQQLADGLSRRAGRAQGPSSRNGRMRSWSMRAPTRSTSHAA